MRYLLKALLVVVPARPDPSDAGAGRRPAGSGREGGVSLADLQQRLHHDAAGLYAARQGLEFPHPLARPDQHPGRGRRQRRPGLRQGGKDPRQGRDARQRRLHRPTPRRPFTHRSTNTADGPFNNLVIALLKPEPRHLHAAGARRSGLPATVRQRARARLAAATPSRARPPGRSRRPRRDCASSSTATSLRRSSRARWTARWRCGPAISTGRSPARRARSATAGPARINLVEFELK